ncbi:hypothetical protein BG000_005695 [Podila horticola]|nr:hypothetical protein BG000_005695 [Podila horticola]
MRGQWPSLVSLQSWMEAAVLAYQTVQALPRRFFQQQAQATGKSVYGPVHDYGGGRSSRTVYNPDGSDRGIITMGPVHNAAAPSSSSAMELGNFVAPRYPQHLSEAERTRRCNLGLCLYCGGQGHFSDNCPHKKTVKTAAAKLQVLQEGYDLHAEDHFNNSGKVNA